MFEPILEEIESLTGRIRQLDGMIRRYAGEHFKEDIELLQTIPGVGLVTSTCFVAAIPSADIFEDPRDAGAYFGLVPRQDQSGDTDRPRHITKEGNGMARRNLVTAANCILRDVSPDTGLKRFGVRVRGPGNGKVAKRRAKTALARKLAVVMAAMLKSRKPYDGTGPSREVGGERNPRIGPRRRRRISGSVRTGTDHSLSTAETPSR